MDTYEKAVQGANVSSKKHPYANPGPNLLRVEKRNVSIRLTA
jgi:hypothetical protein